jgi:glycosyltransferase involved in cell wall biosynthesis
MKQEKKQVLLLVQNLPVPFDRRVWLEATTLSQNGYEVTVVCPTSEKHSSNYEEIDSVKIIRFPFLIEGRNTFGTLIEYLWTISCMFSIALFLAIRKKIDIVHFCNPPDLLFICALPAKLLRKSNLIFDQHDLCPELWQTKTNEAKKSLVFRLIIFFEKMSYRISDLVIAPNESYRNIAIERGEVDEERIFVVRSGPKLEFMRQTRKDIENCETAVKLVYLGTMGSQEGIELLLDSMKILIDANQDVRYTLNLLGDGPERVRLEAYAKVLEISQSCTFRGRVSDADLREFLADADLAINSDRPGLFNDLSSMNKIVEYMAFGLPIIQYKSKEGTYTAQGAAESVEQPNSNALAIAIEKLRLDPRRREVMSKHGIKRFQEICWESQAERLLECYKSLAKYNV